MRLADLTPKPPRRMGNVATRVLVVGSVVLLVILPTAHPWFVACPHHGLPRMLVIGLVAMSATCGGTLALRIARRLER